MAGSHFLTSCHVDTKIHGQVHKRSKHVWTICPFSCILGEALGAFETPGYTKGPMWMLNSYENLALIVGILHLKRGPEGSLLPVNFVNCSMSPRLVLCELSLLPGAMLRITLCVLQSLENTMAHDQRINLHQHANYSFTSCFSWYFIEYAIPFCPGDPGPIALLIHTELCLIDPGSRSGVLALSRGTQIHPCNLVGAFSTLNLSQNSSPFFVILMGPNCNEYQGVSLLMLLNAEESWLYSLGF